MSFRNILFKINSGIIKIPTLFGMGVLLIGLAAGLYLVSQNQILKSKAAGGLTPKNINIANLSADSATIYWQTDGETSGFIQAGTSINGLRSNFRDDRDVSSPQPHKFHFVTLTNLQPNTTYYYQIYSGTTVQPIIPANFKTPATVALLNWPPLVGTILDSNNKPVDEAFITLNLTNAQQLATITKTGGNFILPLSNLKTSDLSSPYPENNMPYKAELNIVGRINSSKAQISLPPQDTFLAPIFLDQNIDLTTSEMATLSAEINKYDVNGDGLVNAADLSTILKNFGAELKNPKTDLNGDGTANQKDVDLIIPYLK